MSDKVEEHISISPNEINKLDLEVLEKTENVEINSQSQPDKEDWNYPKRNRYKLLATFYGFIVVGMSDSSIGVLLPSLQSYYGLNYLVVSLAFLTPFTGYTTGALLSDKIHRLIGRWGVLIMGPICEMVCYIVVSTAPPFPVFVVMYGIAGFGNGLLDSTINSWAGGLQHSNQVLGLLHGFYGVGGIICPATFTAMIAHGVRWNYCYFLMIAMSLLSAVSFFFTFRDETGKSYQNAVDDRVLEVHEDSAHLEHQGKHKRQSILWQTLSSRLIWLIAVDLFLMVGAGVSFGGWISTFMIKIRHGIENEMGYVTTGFWAGLAVGRMILGFIVGHFQHEDYFVLLFMSLAIGCLIIVWLVPVLGVSAAFAALFGIFMGPLYPTILGSSVKKLPKHLHVSGIGFCCAIAGGGAALPPFINGVIANKFGPRVLGPFTLISLGLMLLIWLIVLKLHPIRVQVRACV